MVGMRWNGAALTPSAGPVQTQGGVGEAFILAVERDRLWFRNLYCFRVRPPRWPLLQRWCTTPRTIGERQISGSQGQDRTCGCG